MMNYACDFSQSETEKYFEWIMISFMYGLGSVTHYPYVQDVQLWVGDDRRNIERLTASVADIRALHWVEKEDLRRQHTIYAFEL